MSSHLRRALQEATNLAPAVLPRPPRTTLAKIHRDELAEEWAQFRKNLQRREEQRFQEKYDLKKAEHEKAELERQEVRRLKQIAALKRQAYWSRIHQEHRAEKTRVVDKKAEFRKAKEELMAKARAEFLQALNEEAHLWTKSPEDLRFRAYHLLNRRVIDRLPKNHTYVVDM